MTWEQMQETMAFLLESTKSHDAQIEKLIDSMKEWQEDRRQMHTTMLNVFERMEKNQKDTFARMDRMEAEARELSLAADARSQAADARMARLEKLFEQSITRGKNGQ